MYIEWYKYAENGGGRDWRARRARRPAASVVEHSAGATRRDPRGLYSVAVVALISTFNKVIPYTSWDDLLYKGAE